MKKQTEFQERDLFSDDLYSEYVGVAIERVRDALRFAERLKRGKALVAFSGGKDSVCLYEVVKRACRASGLEFSEACEAEYSVTNLDPPELVRFIREQYPEVRRHLPEKTFWTLCEEKMCVPSRFMRFCCQELKEARSKEFALTFTGVRRAEGVRRSKRMAIEEIGRTAAQRKDAYADVMRVNDNTASRRELEYCMQSRGYVCNPLIDWPDALVWKFIRTEGLPYCSLYDEGFHRLGCIGCPMQTADGMRRQFGRWPKYRAQYERTMARVQRRRIESGKEPLGSKNGLPYGSVEAGMEFFMRSVFLQKDVDLFREETK